MYPSLQKQKIQKKDSVILKVTKTMAMPKLLSVLFLQLVFVVLISDHAYGQSLSPTFYQKTCPNLEKIVRQTTAQFISRVPSLAAPLLRMHFHDCFVRVRCLMNVSSSPFLGILCVYQPFCGPQFFATLVGNRSIRIVI